ncbi:hypothetical protein [Streptomyces sp. RFCAC02]|uniref:hypothetical protein n=1 Tax=Streptomyces sp. RFCAC02 TaxID=2499143 RepID=UPI001021AF6F|nr:hypothetical protein [Streptomyces sp. RFCAC02]
MAVTAAGAAGTTGAAAADGDPPAPVPGDQPSVRVSPAGPRPGEDVELTVTGCAERRGTVRSDGFAAEARLAPAPEDDGQGLFGEARVRTTAEPGVYSIRVACDGSDAKVSGRLVITGRGGDEPGGAGGQDRTGRPGDAGAPGGAGRGDGGGVPGGAESPGAPEHGRAGGPAPRPTGPVAAGGGGTAGDASPAGFPAPDPAGIALGTAALLGAGGLAARRGLRQR